MGKGIEHTDVGDILTKLEYHAEGAHYLGSGTSFPGSPSEMDLFYRTDEHLWYIYNNSTWTIINASPVKTASCIVFLDGSTYKAVNGTTGAVLSENADAITVLHAARDACAGIIVVRQATYSLATSAFSPASNQAWILEDGVVFTQTTNNVGIVNIVGTAEAHKENITILCLGTVIWQHSAGNTQDDGLDMRYCDNVVIRAVNQLLITNVGMTAVKFYRNNNDCILENIKATDWGGRNNAADARNGFECEGASNRNIVRNFVADGNGIAIVGSPGTVGPLFWGDYFGASADNRIEGGQFNNSADDNGIYLDAGVPSNLKGLVIDGAVARGNGDASGNAGFKIKGSGVQLKNLVAIENQTGLILEVSSNATADMEGLQVSGLFNDNIYDGIMIDIDGDGYDLRHVNLDVECSDNGRNGISLYQFHSAQIEYITINARCFNNGADGIEFDTEGDAAEIIRYVFIEGFFCDNGAYGMQVYNEAGISNLYASNGAALGNSSGNESDAGNKLTLEADFKTA